VVAGVDDAHAVVYIDAAGHKVDSFSTRGYFRNDWGPCSATLTPAGDTVVESCPGGPTGEPAPLPSDPPLRPDPSPRGRVVPQPIRHGRPSPIRPARRVVRTRLNSAGQRDHTSDGRLDPPAPRGAVRCMIGPLTVLPQRARRIAEVWLLLGWRAGAGGAGAQLALPRVSATGRGRRWRASSALVLRGRSRWFPRC
jgi:hypothetical protein